MAGGDRAPMRSQFGSQIISDPQNSPTATIWFGGLINMKAETCTTTVDTHEYKLVCERCGSLTVVLPIEISRIPVLF
jgi:hypothetical protein